MGSMSTHPSLGASCYAHTRAGRPETDWQDLRAHLEGVARLAGKAGARFGAGDWARVAGLWHDLGKYSDAFQNYLRSVSPDPHRADASPRTDHSTAGAQHAAQTLGILGHLLAYPIAGHHSGLLDGRSHQGACQDARLQKEVEPYGHAPAAILAAPELDCPGIVADALGRKDAFCVAFFVRMLFSCLVDADFLDTEEFLQPDRTRSRPAWSSDILQRMAVALDSFIASLHRASSSTVDEHRAEVLAACLAAAEKRPGFFSLTVPTGGGKTLSSLAFGLRHAIRHRLDRVIYVAPFTTIIEQNADVFRRAMESILQEGLSDPVLEHHSNLDEGNDTVASRLAAENWDAPLIVTTSVQLYESLFACRPSRCRKLHRVARSVIILDEAQTLPVDLLDPTLRALHELGARYGTTVLFCTATQPAIGRRDDFPIGIDGIREIVREPRQLYEAMKRAEVTDLGPIRDSEVSARLSEHRQVLCVVNTRSHARTLYHASREDGETFHLSALMCPEHRTQKLEEIRRRLENGAECRLISTQLIEAGVDIDFPVVFRSLAGIDSIAQAAGRCNRNGVLPHLGSVYLFRSEHVRSEQFFRDTTNCASQILPLFNDPLSLDAVERYFQHYYWEQSARWDAKQISDEFHLLQDRSLPFSFGFATVANRYRLIEDTGRPVIVPWGPRGRRLCEELRGSADSPDRRLLRALQRFTVRVPRHSWDKHAGRSIEILEGRYPVLLSPELCYSEELGLSLDGDSSAFLNI